MTLNQAIKNLRELVLSHRQVNSFYLGHISEWSEFSGLSYPSVVVTLGEPVIGKNMNRLNLSFWISDRLTEDNSNRDEVLSDTLQILNDLISLMHDQDYEWLPDTDEKQASFYDDELNNDNNDRVGGIKFDFELGLYHVKDRCRVPVAGDAQSGNFILTEDGLYIRTEDNQSIETES
jgi:hypothetical protein